MLFGIARLDVVNIKSQVGQLFGPLRSLRTAWLRFATRARRGGNQRLRLWTLGFFCDGIFQPSVGGLALWVRPTSGLPSGSSAAARMPSGHLATTL